MKTHNNIPLPLLDANQRQELVFYAKWHGRTWKRQLNSQWMYASASFNLMAVRNRLGPTWLNKVCPSSPKDIAKLPVIKRCPTCGAHADLEMIV